MKPVIIVEGKNDRSKLAELLLPDAIDIYCTYGTPGERRMQQLKERIGERPVYIWTDNDRPGGKIRALLGEAFPDAEHMYTSKGYAGVEGTPREYLLERLIKGGLDECCLHPSNLQQENNQGDRQHTHHRRGEHRL